MGLLHMAAFVGLMSGPPKRKGSLPCPSHRQVDPGDRLRVGQRCREQALLPAEAGEALGTWGLAAALV